MKELNLKGVKCPLNFVKAKLALEKMAVGEELKIFVDLGESAESVIKSLLQEGYMILSQNENTNLLELIVKVS